MGTVFDSVGFHIEIVNNSNKVIVYKYREGIERLERVVFWKLSVCKHSVADRLSIDSLSWVPVLKHGPRS